MSVALAGQVLRALDVRAMPNFSHGLKVDAISPDECLTTTVNHSVNLVAAHEVLSRLHWISFVRFLSQRDIVPGQIIHLTNLIHVFPPHAHDTIPLQQIVKYSGRFEGRVVLAFQWVDEIIEKPIQNKGSQQQQPL